MKTYKGQNTWHEIGKNLPEHNRITDTIFPNEIFIDWKNNKIHIVKKKTVTYTDWADLVCHIIEIEKEKNERPIFVFGLSAGGMLAYHACAMNPGVKGLIVTNLLDQRMQAVRDYSSGNKIISRLGIPLLSILAKINGELMLPMKALANMKAIVNDTKVLKLLLNDNTSSGTKVPLNFVISLLICNPKIEPENFNVCPVLLVHPELDKWTPVEISRLFFDKISCEKNLKILENAGHFPIENPGLKQLEEYVVEFIGKYT